MSYLLAFDAGTGSVRAVLFDTKGTQIGVAQKEWIHVADEKHPGSMDFDYTENWQLILSCVEQLLQKTNIDPKDIKAISATSMREGFVLYDKKGQEIWACANVDARATEEVKYLKTLDADIEKKIYHLSGQTFALGALPRLLWLKNHKPDIYKQATSLTMINDWILYKLSGQLQVDPSNGCTTGIFDVKTRQWKTEIADICGIKTNLFPAVNEAGTILGNVTENVSRETNLSQATVVVSGGGDAQMATVGVGAIHANQTVISGGSFWQQTINIQEPLTDADGHLRINCHAVPNVWQIETIAFNPGLAMRWFRDAFCQLEQTEAILSGRDVYELLEEQAKDVPIGSHGIIPIFSDTMNYMSWRHAAPSFINLSLDPLKSGKKELFKSLQENATLITLGNLQLIKEKIGFYPSEVIFAGGASKGKLWSQTLADVLGVTVKIPIVKEAAALGTALYAGVGAGLYPTIQEGVQSIIEWDRIHIPNMENHQKYQDIYQTWKQVYKEQLKLADAGLTTHMWKAPGL
ncbi:autoinducer-2 kinase [Bacillus massiliigorillae]|uniref:autoinducer-2 kinase n=1 Tax=Bacillus massiliigorillae TaxID=1243664 RepID=UPI0003A708DC|nr:autoinducer-2 kinase [Bacillus massiliigorillae]